MSDIQFACPTCSHHLIIDAEGAGMEVDCPGCGKTIRVPEPETAPAMAHASTAEASISPREEIETDVTPAAAHPEGLHLKKSASEVWKEHHPEGEDHSHLPPEAAAIMSPAAAGSGHVEQHGSDVNIDQPWEKKKDQWFTKDGKHYHYCFYNPHGPLMEMACGQDQMPITANVAPVDLGRLRKSALCRKCQEALG